MSQGAFIRFVRTGKTMPLERATASMEDRERFLKPHAGHATVQCLCANPPIPMTVAHRRVGAETWYLCPSSSEDKNRHAEWCPHHLGGGEGATSDVNTPPAVTVEDGMATIRGGFPRTWTEPKAGATRSNGPTAQEPGNASPRAGLAILLWALWSQAELNAWKPFFNGKRFYGFIRDKLLTAARNIRLESGRSAWNLSEDLRIPPAWSPSDPRKRADCLHFERELQERLSDNKVLFLAGQMRKLEEVDGEGGRMIFLSHFRHGVWVPPGAAKKLEKATSQWAGGMDGGDGDKRFALLRVRAKRAVGIQQKEMPEMECIDITVQRFSKDWIPLESDRERQVSDRLVEEGREFVKPFPQANRKDWISGLCHKLGVVPDFVLTDRKPAVFMEVLGMMNDPSYRTRTAEKMSIYHRTGRPVWIWDVLHDDQIPELP